MADRPVAGALYDLINVWVGHLSASLGLPHRGEGAGLTGPAISREQNLSAAEWLRDGRWAVGVSTNVTAIRYDREYSWLYVVFVENPALGSRRRKHLSRARVYRYNAVTPEVALGMFLSPSLGTYVHDVLIARNYSYDGPRVIL